MKNQNDVHVIYSSPFAVTLAWKFLYCNGYKRYGERMSEKHNEKKQVSIRQGPKAKQ